ncbi:MAG: DUF1847 domain-containing protein [Deltaproteobacteria bacterium]|nr:DUF1847 domain-containing protein [Deltaproteobacteria bacterium]
MPSGPGLRMGIVCCVGLRKEAAIAQSIFEAQGFESAASSDS